MLSPTKFLVAIMAFYTMGLAAPVAETDSNILVALACPCSSHSACITSQKASCAGVGGLAQMQGMNNADLLCSRELQLQVGK
ncbi:hypothetical protein FZEAL_6821 [Fusarium zealandicum]|uniref:Uncharacterized protein n=1 Tax=Fusarium zealandicum TaxID=1053134 RepID=A0A8H4UI23_9HYPO|nr:hypothetical protein FZEAL_6821 [Fusarium zealandicum]